MKKITLGIGLMLALLIVNIHVSAAQSVNINVNIGNQPAWGPAGYDYAGYYYFPDIDIYYDVNNYLFYYPERGRFVASRYLPYSYAQYDLYNMYKVVLNQPMPWRYNSRYKKQYARYRGTPAQVIILNSPDRRFYGSRENRIAWVNPNRYGRYPYHNQYSRPNNNQRPGDGARNEGRRQDKNQYYRSGYNKTNIPVINNSPDRTVYSGRTNDNDIQKRPIYEPGVSRRTEDNRDGTIRQRERNSEKIGGRNTRSSSINRSATENNALE